MMHQEENSTCINHVLFTLASKKPKEWAQGEDKILVWLASGNVNKYLGFPINYNMPQKEKDHKILQSIRGKQVAWTSKKLSFVAKNLVVNQVILVSIWYVVSCVNLSLFSMKKVKSLKPSRWKSKGKGGMEQYHLY